MSDRALTIREVCEITGLSRTSIFRLESRFKTFPRRRQLSPNRVCWIESEVLAWLASRPVAEAKL